MAIRQQTVDRIEGLLDLDFKTLWETSTSLIIKQLLDNGFGLKDIQDYLAAETQFIGFTEAVLVL